MILLPPPADTLVPVWQWFLATWFGAGLMEPLRAGLAVATAGVFVLLLAGRGKLAIPLSGALVLLVGVFVSTAIGEASGIEDDRRIVIDEVAAFILGGAFLQTVRQSVRWAALAAFGAVFLFLDRIKPWPFHYLEALPDGWGVMADDLGLGLFLGAISFTALVAKRKLRDA